MLESTLTSKGQTTLPKEVREALGLKPGDRVRYRLGDGEVRLVRPRDVRLLRGAARYEGRARSLEEMQEGIAEGATAKDKGE